VEPYAIFGIAPLPEFGPYERVSVIQCSNWSDTPDRFSSNLRFIRIACPRGLKVTRSTAIAGAECAHQEVMRPVALQPLLDSMRPPGPPTR
jgi:hypothetical protein